MRAEDNVIMNISVKDNERIKVQNLYVNYYNSGKDEDYEAITSFLEMPVRRYLRRQLTGGRYYSEQNIDDIMQDMHISLYKEISKKKEEGQIIPDLITHIYKTANSRMIDYIRKEDKHKNVVSIDEHIEKDNKDSNTYEEIIDDKNSWDFQNKERLKVVHGYLRIYCSEMMNSEKEPWVALALCYARVIPHILGGIPDTKGSSIKYAVKLMDNKIIDQLGIDAERELTSSISKSLVWGDYYSKRVKESETIDGVDHTIGDIIYTSVFSTKQMDYWDRNFHSFIGKRIFERANKDKELSKMAEEYSNEFKWLRLKVKEDR